MTAAVIFFACGKMPARIIFIVVLAISLVGAAPSALKGPNNDTEPIEQIQMETLGEVLQEQWSEKSYSTSEEETSNRKELLDSPSLSPSLEASQEDTFSSKFPGGSDLAKVEDIVDAIEADRQLEAIVLKTVEPTKLVGAGLATVLQQELPRGFTEDNLLHMIGPEYQEDLNRMSYEEIMDALTEKVEELEEEAEAQLTPEERAAWDEAIAKEGEIKDLEEEEELEEEKPEVIVWYEIEEGEVYYGKEMPELEEEENIKEAAGPGNYDYDWRVQPIHVYPSEPDENLKEWEKWAETSLEEAEQEEDDLWSCHLGFIPTFFACLLIVVTLVIITHQCYIEKRWKRRASLERQDSALPVKEPLTPPVYVIVPQQKGQQYLY